MTEQSNFKKAGVNRIHGHSFPEKLTFALGHLFIVVISAYLLYGHGLETSGLFFGKYWYFSDPDRALILLVCSVIYFIRQSVTLFYLLNRKVEWSESLGLLFTMAIFEIGLLILGGGVFRNESISLNLIDVLAVILYLIGSFLNSCSEIKRKWWKANPRNKGHCYTQGLFAYSMHINYFGDTVLFTGWCLFTHNVWIILFPLLMVYSFIFIHIPGLDSYLAEKYGNEFTLYSEKTKKFIPFIY